MLRAELEKTLNRVWYTPHAKGLKRLLLPFSLIYGAMARYTWRKFSHQRTQALPVPVVVVGNIVAGGSGKTPVTQALAIALKARGLRIGIVSRGYGGSTIDAECVHADQPSRFGDEPCLLAATTGCPVAVARVRVDAVRLLCKQFELDLILSDDGLQHASLHRDFELCVVGPRGLGNGSLLPAGPLREPMSRLASVSAVLAWGERCAFASPNTPQWVIHGAHSPLQLLSGNSAPEGTLQALAVLQNKEKTLLFAAAGLAQPERFYVSLAGAGLQFKTLAVADHALITLHQLNQIPLHALLIVTEKDAVKLREAQLPAQLQKRIRIVPWRVNLPIQLIDDIARLVLPRA
jgi:tetraacyldisaccharide 4'-kinase